MYSYLCTCFVENVWFSVIFFLLRNGSCCCFGMRISAPGSTRSAQALKIKRQQHYQQDKVEPGACLFPGRIPVMDLGAVVPCALFLTRCSLSAVVL